MKALVLFSGGLDSILAAKLIQRQGIEVEGVHYVTPFTSKQRGHPEEVGRIAERNGIPCHIQQIGEEYFSIITHPAYGVGKHANPCIDCRIFMLRKAQERMRAQGAGFLVTGEVVGQRPMTQQKHCLNRIDKHSGLKGLVLRPLSAELLKETLPEIRGWVRREELCAVSGRGRKRQFALAEEFGVTEYFPPAGGCLLTSAGFCSRLKDLLAHGNLNLRNVEVLKTGRHFRLTPQYKLVVARDERENRYLAGYARYGDTVVTAREAGPYALGIGEANRDAVRLSRRIVARYVSRQRTVPVAAGIYPQKDLQVCRVSALEEDRLKKYLI
ncbi:MAG: hypothetical protein GF333_04125 [Candidatus Omnitrophica bacterium]|nr:hypothetical protein [Candidatus Omnitrophota bacterium]